MVLEIKLKSQLIDGIVRKKTSHTLALQNRWFQALTDRSTCYGANHAKYRDVRGNVSPRTAFLSTNLCFTFPNLDELICG
jgi:hypothetical protein